MIMRLRQGPITLIPIEALLSPMSPVKALAYS